jgi:uncharacterized membrane protein
MSLARARPRPAPVALAATGASGRVIAVDVVRGLAIVAMIAYHFAFDLRYFGITHSDFEHARFWLCARATILSTFLATAGVSLALADAAHVGFARHLARVARIAACALLVTLASYVLFAQSFIYFGVLHAIAVIGVVAWPLRGRPVTATVLGIAVVLAGLAFAHPAFDARALSWIGFITHKPRTEDYVPLFPWAGVTLIGIGAGHMLRRRAFAPIGALARAPRALALLGRHSLAVYMLHQPLLIAALWMVLRAEGTG